MMSVPPEIDWSGSGPTASATQSNCHPCSTAPVDMIDRSVPGGSTSAGR